MAEVKMQLTAGGWREYEGPYKPEPGDLKRLGFAWFIYENGRWRKLKPKEFKAYNLKRFGKPGHKKKF